MVTGVSGFCSICSNLFLYILLGAEVAESSCSHMSTQRPPLLLLFFMLYRLEQVRTEAGGRMQSGFRVFQPVPQVPKGRNRLEQCIDRVWQGVLLSPPLITSLFTGALNAARCEARTIPRPVELLVSR